jgi:hypothetical protein
MPNVRDSRPPEDVVVLCGRSPHERLPSKSTVMDDRAERIERCLDRPLLAAAAHDSRYRT